MFTEITWWMTFLCFSSFTNHDKCFSALTLTHTFNWVSIYKVTRRYSWRKKYTTRVNVLSYLSPNLTLGLRFLSSSGDLEVHTEFYFNCMRCPVLPCYHQSRMLSRIMVLLLTKATCISDRDGLLRWCPLEYRWWSCAIAEEAVD